jgi:tRNA (guanosine-2'-O-)-methyltransferase
MSFGIGIEYPKADVNASVLARSAYNLGANFVFTIGRKYKRGGADTCNAPAQIPFFNFQTWDDYFATKQGWQLVGVEITENAVELPKFVHPKQCVYLLGNEANGLSKEALKRCATIVKIPSKNCLNVAMCGTVVMYDRLAKGV